MPYSIHLNSIQNLDFRFYVNQCDHKKKYNVKILAGPAQMYKIAVL